MPSHILPTERTVLGLHKALLSRLPKEISKDDSILDVGCGTGAWLTRLHQEGYRSLYGVDKDQASRRTDFATLQHADLDAQEWHYKAGEFALITLIEVIEHLENPGNILHRISICLQSRGFLLLTSPNLHSIGARARFLATGKLRHFDQYGDPTHIYPVFLPNLEKLLARHNLTIVDKWGYPSDGSLSGTRPWLVSAFRLLRKFFPEEVSGDILCVLARKNDGQKTQN